MLSFRAKKSKSNPCQIVFFFLCTFIVLGCSVGGSPNANLMPLGLIAYSELPITIKDSAQKVGRLSLRGKSAMGVFVDNEGRFLTSTEVIGPLNCAKEGCFVQLQYQYRGKTVKKKVLAKVRAVIPDAEKSSIVDLYKLENGEPKGRLVRDDIGAPIIFQAVEFDRYTYAINYLANGSLIGIPFGEISEGQNEWKIAGEADFLLGAPLFNRVGQFVGVVAQTGLKVNRRGEEFLYSSFVVNNQSIGTVLLDLNLGNNRGLHLTSLKEKNTYSENPDLYLNAEKSLAISNGLSIHIAELLKRDCANPETFDEGRSCLSMLDWINCGPSRTHFQYCPEYSERDDWAKLLEKAVGSVKLTKNKLKVVASSYKKIYSDYSSIELANRYCNFALTLQADFDFDSLLGWSLLFEGNPWPSFKCNGTRAEDFIENFVRTSGHLALPEFALELLSFGDAPISVDKRRLLLNQIVNSNRISISVRMQAFFQQKRLNRDNVEL